MRRLLSWRPRGAHRLVRWRLWALPTGLAVLLVAVGLAGSAVPLVQGPQKLADLVLAGTAALGLRVDDIVVEGRQTTARQTILDALAAARGTPILGVDLERARARLQALPWVSSAMVVRRLPDTLYVRLVERKPLALWQHDGKIELIDRQGSVIAATGLDRFAKLPLVVGADAAVHAAELLDMLASEPELAPHVNAAIRVGGRRWNLRLDDAVDVLLPETGAPAAWARLARLEHRQKLLERQIAAIDMRLPDRLVLPAAAGAGAGGRSEEGAPAGEEHMSVTDWDNTSTTDDADGNAARPRRPSIRPRGSTIAALDIGSTKVCCFIARVTAEGARVVGIGHQVSRGVRNGRIIDLEAAGVSASAAVHAAEEMAGEQIQQITTSLSGGFAASRIIRADIAIAGREITEAETRRVLEQGYLLHEPGDRIVIHSVPVGFSVDDSRGIRDPRGMFGDRLGVNMNVVTAAAAQMRNLSTAIGRSHLGIDGLVVSPYAAGLASLVDDEIDLGVTVIDMGGGTTTIGVFFDGNLIFADSIAVGGGHVTNDIARGLSTSVANAERMKTLYGSAIAASTDERETIAVPQLGEEEDGHVNHIPKSLLISIIAPRLEETFELVRNHLEASGFDKLAGRRIVLTGGACQLQGARELAGLILDKQVRIGRPLGVAGLAEATGGPAFSTAVGLLHFALSERAEAPRLRRGASRPSGVFGRMGQWLREYF